MNNRLITVAIHTFDRANELKSLLEREGIAVTLQNVNLDQPVVSSGVRVRIKESDLPFALRIIENQDIFSQAKSNSGNSDTNILVPVDFSPHSVQACNIAFSIASRLKSGIHLLHTYTDPTLGNSIPLSDVLSFDSNRANEDELLAIENEAKRQMDLYTDALLSKMKSGELPVVKLTSEIQEGIPEEVINQYAKENAPVMIVMGTRGAQTKERELVGSVTAEVLDTCRYPVFTVPESFRLNKIEKIDSILFFSNFDQEDILAIDALFRLLPIDHLNIILIRIPGKKLSEQGSLNSLKRLEAYCMGHYPQHKFSIDTMSIDSIEEDFSRITASSSCHLIAVPNKKKNMFARLFNPGIAHRILFHSDTPMVVIPV